MRLHLIPALLIGAVVVHGAAAQDSAAPQPGLPASVQSVATRFHVPEASLGLIVQEVGAETPLISINPDVARNPASTIKIVTTMAALEELGPAYTWPTEVYTDGTLADGMLTGNLIIKGYGDPYLVHEEFWKLLQGLRRLGLRDIQGDFIVDNSYFLIPPEDPGAFDGRPFHAYNVLPDALLVNFKAAQFHFYPTKNGTMNIVSEPELANLTIDNRVRTTDARCAGSENGLMINVPDPVNANTIVFDGFYPRSCGYFVLSRAVLTPPAFAYGVFVPLWQQLGGTISGSMRIGPAPAGRKPLYIWRSRPLGEIIRLVNKNSNNVMTRQLLLTLAAELASEPGTVEDGTEVVNRYLLERGISPASLILDNGAGLSRDVRVSPQLIADLLQHARRIPYMPEFVASLSILGIDGTARNRMKLRREAGHAHVKTGTIDHVSSIAGYVDTESGRTFVVVGIVNNPNAHLGPGVELWNALVQWVFGL
jgi:D-alanyl-D-alanine carboxypeptidase/D-alanyl-D-alanine-endopeptidase (penicillin-binding protein 4)